ncbi:UvrD-helicase domain-containing protein, partial [Klebsiella pneumoniae]|nr:UvrD-helicase domain-containing protein [Klebsiella pneumoniae]
MDEYQDTKQIQYSILTSILRAGRGETKILIVGDPNQAIYGSLGGYAMPLDEFRAQAGIPIKEFALSLNYRSSERIISYFSNYSVHASKITGAGKDAKFPSRI